MDILLNKASVQFSSVQFSWGLPCGSDSKASACNAGDPGLIPGSGRSPGEGNGNLLQYSCLENSMDWGAWCAAVHGVPKNRTQLSNWTETETEATNTNTHTHTHTHTHMYIYRERTAIVLRRTCVSWKRKSDFYWPFLVQFSRSVVSDTLWSHELQYTMPPCPSPTTGVHSNPCPLTQWCHPSTSSSVVPFSSCSQSFPASGSFPMSQFFASSGQSIGASASPLVLPMNTQDWSPLGWTGWILQSKELSRVFSNTTVQRHQFFIAQLSL